METASPVEAAMRTRADGRPARAIYSGSHTILAGAVAALVMMACAAPVSVPVPGPAPEGAAPALPPVPTATGPLDLEVVYPNEGQTIGVRDSTFIFGNVGTGGASLTINGHPVDVAANGAFLAFLPVPENGVYELVATANGETGRMVRTVELPPAAAAPVPALRVVPGSMYPGGPITEVAGGPVDVRLRATPGADVQLVLPSGLVVPLVERTARDEAQGFMLDRAQAVGAIAEYAGVFAAEPIGGAAGEAVVRVVRGADTVRVPFPGRVAVNPAHSPRVAIAASARTDRTVIGRAIPGGGTPYHWFFPSGALLTITGARGGQYRVALSDDLAVWVDTAEVDLLPAGTPAPTGTVGTVRAISEAEWVDVRLSTSARLPFRVEPRPGGLTVRVYGAESRTNWLQYGESWDGLIERMDWEQPEDDIYRLDIDLADRLWGYLAFYDEAGNVVVRVRRPPAIDPNDPLRGLYIGVDAGHPPGGAVGPTGYTEAEANLAISKYLVEMLREHGARVLEIRPTEAAVGLGDRPLMATDSSVHLLVSVHNNAFPDGVNPWENNGTSVFYNQAQSLDLARELQRELLAEFRLRDLGIARADLALVRPTWMPSALTETMFLMIPQQEAALKDPEVQQRIARAHLRGLQAFLRDRAIEGR